MTRLIESIKDSLKILKLMESNSSDMASKVLAEILTAFKQVSRGTATSPVEGDGSGWCQASIRNWGKWETPKYQDDEDYDWQELTPEYQNKATEIIKHFKQKYPDFRISYQAGEKNWITFQLSAAH
jgi:hypothetical protein